MSKERLTLVFTPRFTLSFFGVQTMITIGKVAALANVSTDTLRYYEQEGLIQPSALSDSGYRLYGDDAAPRLLFIKHAQACGFTLAEIRELLQMREHSKACCNDVKRIVVEKKLQLEAKIKAMALISQALDVMIEHCSGDTSPVDNCSILAGLEQAEVGHKQ